VIPVQKNKKPYVAWEKYQREHPSEDQIKEWWQKYPIANVAIVTGPVSGISVVDVDSEEARDSIEEHMPDSLITPTCQTPRGGWHYYFQSENGLGNAGGFLEKCDFRGEGGYIIAPPSEGYAWLPKLSVYDVELCQLPEGIYNLLQGKKYYDSAINQNNLQVVTNSYKQILQGKRDDALFHIANHLIKGKMPIDEVREVLAIIALHGCKPPFPLKEVDEKIKSLFKRVKRQLQTVTSELQDYVAGTSGYFSTNDCYTALHATTKQEKGSCRVTLCRMVEDGVIEKHKDRNGIYRKVEEDIVEINFLADEREPVDLWLPFDMHRMVELYPGNIVLIAGERNAGKTAMMLNIIRKNMAVWNTHYFNSEMGQTELKKRLLKFEYITLPEWNFKAWERNENFADVIKSGEGNLNVIDYMEIYDNFWEVAGKINRIHQKLNGAVAVIAIQKPKGRDTGLGGEFTLDKPRLACALSPGVLKIIKAKNWITDENPNEKEFKFKLVSGCNIIWPVNDCVVE